MDGHVISYMCAVQYILQDHSYDKNDVKWNLMALIRSVWESPGMWSISSTMSCRAVKLGSCRCRAAWPEHSVPRASVRLSFKARLPPGQMYIWQSGTLSPLQAPVTTMYTFKPMKLPVHEPHQHHWWNHSARRPHETPLQTCCSVCA